MGTGQSVWLRARRVRGLWVDAPNVSPDPYLPAVGKQKRRNAERLRKRMRRPARLADARLWLSTHPGGDVVRAYERWYGVDRLCAITELRLLGVPISEAYEAQVRDSFDRRAKARAAKRVAKQRGATTPAPPADLYEDIEPIEGIWNAEDDDASAGWEDVSLDAGYDAMADLAPDRSGGPEDWQLEDALFEEARVLDLKVVETTIETLDEAMGRVRITLEGDPEVLATCAWGLIFAIGALSFDDAEIDFVANDEWKAADMLRCLSFDRGRLYFHADHVRGRCMKTTIEIDPEGKITLETVNRGEAATRWISKLQGNQARPGVEGGASLDELPF
jgi:ribosomal protein L34E